MALQWSGLAPEVLLTLDRSRSVPLRAQLEDQFRQAIRSARSSSRDCIRPRFRQLLYRPRLGLGCCRYGR